MKKVDYLVTAKCEALYEYANSVMAKYEDYLDSNRLWLHKNIYDDLCDYNTKILLCDSIERYELLLKNIKEFDSIIKHVSDSVMSGVWLWTIRKLSSTKFIKNNSQNY